MKNLFKWIAAFVFPVVFNKFINLSEEFFYKQYQADIADVLVVIGVIGMITVQTYGTYKLFDLLERK